MPAGNDSTTAMSNGGYVDHNYQLTANTTYWFAPGTHTFSTGQFDAIYPASGDTFIGAPGAIIDGQGANQRGIRGQAAVVSRSST